MRDFYSVIGSRSEDQLSNSQLKQLYFEQLRRLHPDKNDGARRDDEFQLLKKAWTVLGDPTERDRYDRWLCEQRLRESKELIGAELRLDDDDQEKKVDELKAEPEQIAHNCRCGGEFCVDVEELRQTLVDYALFECSNCSLLLKIWR